MWLPGGCWRSSKHCVIKCGWSRARALLMQGIARQQGRRVSVLRMPTHTQEVAALQVTRNQLSHSNRFCKTQGRRDSLKFQWKVYKPCQWKRTLEVFAITYLKAVAGWVLCITVRCLNDSQGKDIQDKVRRKGWNKGPEALKHSGADGKPCQPPPGTGEGWQRSRSPGRKGRYQGKKARTSTATLHCSNIWIKS